MALTDWPIEWEDLGAGRCDHLTDEDLDRLTAHPLECVETEFPHWQRSIEDPDEVECPRERHPVFYGCYDWHSAVHSHWSMIRLCRLFPDNPRADAIHETIGERISPKHVEQERAYFEEHDTFERPYGWAWFLRLIAELHLCEGEPASSWRSTLVPLEERIVELVETHLLDPPRPFRVGTHGNTAYGLAAVIDYARTTDRPGLERHASETARQCFVEDTNVPLRFEPLGWDFISPGLTEADLMRRVLPEQEFRSWIAAFLPPVQESPHDSILSPVETEEDGVALHYVGLNLSRAWCLAELVPFADDAIAERLAESARAHAERGISEAFTDSYAGAHWLTSFVIYLISRDHGGIA